MPHYPLFRLLSTSVRLIADLSISQNALLLSANQAYPNIWQRTIIMDYMPWATELQQKNHLRMQVVSLESGGDLLSRAVSSQVPSALKGLTSVFGMGTGGTPSPLPPEISFQGSVPSSVLRFLPLSFPLPPASVSLRTLTTAQTSDFCHLLDLSQSSWNQALDLLVSASFHVTMLTPLTYLPVVFRGSYSFITMGVLISRWASRLDAFSVYPIRTSLPCCALGRTTVAPVVRPFRSSRTRNSSFQNSYAHDG